MLGGEEDTLDIDREQVVPLLLADLVRGLVDADDPRAVDEDVDTAESGSNGSDHLGDLSLVAYVQVPVASGAACRLDFFDSLPAKLVIEVSDRDMSTLGGKE